MDTIKRLALALALIIGAAGAVVATDSAPATAAIAPGNGTCWTGSYYRSDWYDYYGGGYDLVFTVRNGAWFRSMFPYPKSQGHQVFYSSTYAGSVYAVDQYNYDTISGAYYRIGSVSLPYYGNC